MWFELKGDERITQRCASDDCGGQPTFRLEAAGVGANYCSGCKAKIDAGDRLTCANCGGSGGIVHGHGGLAYEDCVECCPDCGGFGYVYPEDTEQAHAPVAPPHWDRSDTAPTEPPEHLRKSAR